MKTYLSTDRGASFTDFAVLSSHNEIIHTTYLPNRKWEDILAVYNRIDQEFSPCELFFTGSVQGLPEGLKGKIHTISEIEAIAFGGAFVSGKEKCLVVSMGTGTAVALFDHGRTMHISGTGVGGGTISGLGLLLAGIKDPLQLNHFALGGKASALNLTLSEVGYEQVGFLDGDLTVSNFGSIKTSRKEDLSAAILCMAAEVTGVIASLSARIYHLEEDIVVTGNLSRSNYIQSSLRSVGQLYNTRFHFPENPEYATAFGAVKSFFYKQIK